MYLEVSTDHEAQVKQGFIVVDNDVQCLMISSAYQLRSQVEVSKTKLVSKS